MTAVERDPVVARYLAHNCPDATVVLADATDGDVLAGLLAASAPPTSCSSIPHDATRPARATPRQPAADLSGTPSDGPLRGRTSQSIDHPRIAAKVAPGFAPPPGWEAQWVSVDRTVVECSLASWPLSGASRRAVVMTPPPPTVVDADPTLSCPRAETIGSWVHEPDPAVTRAGAVPALAAQQGLALLDADSSWLTGETPSSSPALRSYLVLAELVGSPRQQRRQLADLEVSRLTVKSRDVAAEPRDVLRSLGVTEGPERVLVMTRTGRTVAQPADAASTSATRLIERASVPQHPPTAVAPASIQPCTTRAGNAAPSAVAPCHSPSLASHSPPAFG